MENPFNNRDDKGIAGYVITRQIDHKRNGYITCDYITESEAEEKYKETANLLKFPEELTCRKAWLKNDPACGRYYTERK